MKLIQAVKQTQSKVINSKQTVEFKIGDAAKIIEILRSKIYSNPIQTLVQEYLCNARDAIREVKGSEIKVSLPHSDDLNFKVRDFGPGISKDRMLNTFVSYGSTTKDGSNNQTGGFGLGSKLAWAYTDSFNIITFIDGVKTTYLAHIGANKNGTLELMNEETTKEANGTEIVVPVKEDDCADFRVAAVRAVSFWEAKERPTLTVDTYTCGAPAETVLELTNSISIYKRTELSNGFGEREIESSLILSIDGIAYPLSEEFVSQSKELEALANKIASDTYAVFHIGNGQVEIAASRESISENTRTLSVLTSKAKAGLAAANKYTKDNLDKSTDLLSFVSNVKAIQVYLSLSTATFKDQGETFTVETEHGWRGDDAKVRLCSETIAKLDIQSILNDGSKKRSKSWQKGINLDLNMVFVDESISKARVSMKLNQFVKQTRQGAQLILKGTATQAFVNSLAERLNGILLSSIVLPKVERAEAARVAEGYVKVQMFQEKSYSDKKTLIEFPVNLEANADSYVYIHTDNRGKLEQYESLAQFTRNANLRLCIMGTNAIKQVQGNDSFISIETFLADINKHAGKKHAKLLVEEASDHWVCDIFDSLSDVVKHADLIPSINDKKLVADLNTIKNSVSRSRVASLSNEDFLMTHLVKTNAKIAELKTLHDAFPQYIKANYPMVNMVSSYNDEEYDSSTGKYVKKSFTSKQLASEIIAYLNGKHNSQSGVK